MKREENDDGLMQNPSTEEASPQGLARTVADHQLRTVRCRRGLSACSLPSPRALKRLPTGRDS